jgi:hypothetical protein
MTNIAFNFAFSTYRERNKWIGSRETTDEKVLSGEVSLMSRKKLTSREKEEVIRILERRIREGYPTTSTGLIGMPAIHYAYAEDEELIL